MICRGAKEAPCIHSGVRECNGCGKQLCTYGCRYEKTRPAVWLRRRKDGLLGCVFVFAPKRIGLTIPAAKRDSIRFLEPQDLQEWERV